MIEIREITTEETYPIRHTILRPHQPFENCKYETDYLDTSFHMGAFYDGKLVSIASFCEEIHPELNSGKQYRLRAMATLPEFRKQNIGSSIVNDAESKLRKKNIDYLWCKGRTEVQSYYKKLGFVPFGEVFNYPGLGPHIVMVKCI